MASPPVTNRRAAELAVKLDLTSDGSEAQIDSAQRFTRLAAAKGSGDLATRHQSLGRRGGGEAGSEAQIDSAAQRFTRLAVAKGSDGLATRHQSPRRRVGGEAGSEAQIDSAAQRFTSLAVAKGSCDLA